MTDEYKKLRKLSQQGIQLYYAPQIIPNQADKYVVPLMIKNLTKQYIEVIIKDDEILKLNAFDNNIVNIFNSHLDAELNIVKQYESLKVGYDKLQIYMTQFDQLQKDKPYLVI